MCVLQIALLVAVVVVLVVAAVIASAQRLQHVVLRMKQAGASKGLVHRQNAKLAIVGGKAVPALLTVATKLG